MYELFIYISENEMEIYLQSETISVYIIQKSRRKINVSIFK